MTLRKGLLLWGLFALTLTVGPVLLVYLLSLLLL